MVGGLDYFLPSIPFLWFGYLYSIAARTGWFMDEFANACIAAYGHQAQHDNSDLIFWLKNYCIICAIKKKCRTTILALLSACGTRCLAPIRISTGSRKKIVNNINYLMR
jgi:hypothetical protein